MDDQYYIMEVSELNRPLVVHLDPAMGPAALLGDVVVLGFPEQGKVTTLRRAVFDRHFEPVHGTEIVFESYRKVDPPTEPNPKFRKIDG